MDVALGWPGRQHNRTPEMFFSWEVADIDIKPSERAGLCLRGILPGLTVSTTLCMAQEMAFRGRSSYAVDHGEPGLGRYRSSVWKWGAKQRIVPMVRDGTDSRTHHQRLSST